MRNHKVSIIIPIYNSEKYLRKCLDSAINQTLDDIEIICVDNNSTDDSLKVCSEYKFNFPTKIIISEESISGPNNARQKGFDLANGEYIMFLDSDDWLEPNACETCFNLATNNNYDLIEFSLRSIYQNDDKLIEKNDGTIKFSFTNTNPLNPIYFNYHKGLLANLFISKNLLTKNNLRLITLDLFEDTFSTYLIFYYCQNFIAIPDILYNYLRRERSNISRAYFKEGPELLIKANNTFIEEIKNRKLIDKHPEFLLQFLFANLLISDYWLIGLNSFKEKKNYINQVVDLVKSTINIKDVKVSSIRGYLVKLFLLVSMRFNNYLNTVFFIFLRKIYRIVFH